MQRNLFKMYKLKNVTEKKSRQLLVLLYLFHLTKFSYLGDFHKIISNLACTPQKTTARYRRFDRHITFQHFYADLYLPIKLTSVAGTRVEWSVYWQGKSRATTWGHAYHFISARSVLMF